MGSVREGSDSAGLGSLPAAMTRLGAELDLDRVLQQVTDTGTDLTGARFGAFFYNATDESGGSYRLRVVSGADASAFDSMPAPGMTELFEPTFTGRRTVRLGDVIAYRGQLPEGHLPVRSYLGTPVIGRDGSVIGALLFGHPDPEVFDERSEAIALAVAAQAAISVENALLFEQEQIARRDAEDVREQLRRMVAELTDSSRTLQRSLLPSALPAVDGIRAAVRYLPALAHAEVGGDWYDVIASAGDTITLAIGDVQGHNLQAAAEMGRLRTTLRAYLAEGHGPAEALARTNALTSIDSDALLATCCLITIDPRTGGAEIVRAGHPLPILHRADGTTLELATHGGAPLGVSGDQRWQSERLRLRHGDRIVLYTDGLVDVRGVAAESRTAQLRSAVAESAADPPEEAIDHVLRAMAHEDNDDDLAVLICDVTPADHLMTVAAPEQVALARAFVADQVAAWGCAELEQVATLIVSELVTNSLRYGGGAADLVVRRRSDGIRIEVSDANPTAPVLMPVDTGAEGKRGVLLVDALATRWGVDSDPTGKTVWAEIATFPA